MPRGIPNKKKTEAAEEILEAKFEDEWGETKAPNKDIYNIVDANRLRLKLMDKTLDGTAFDNVTIEGSDVRTISFKGCFMKDSTFKNVNMQGCDMSEAEATGNTFIDCDLRWGKKPEGFEKNNTFINTRL